MKALSIAGNMIAMWAIGEVISFAKGVSSAGENVSLTAEQFKEYHDITNQIAEKFLSLINGFDSEGNAILKN